MRVLHVLEAVGGGTMRHVEDLVQHSLVEHHVACPLRRATDLSHPDPTGLLRGAGADVHTVAMSRRPFDGANLRAVRQISRLIDVLAPDVLHAHASVAGALARVAARGRVPVVWTPHAVHDRRWALGIERRLRPLADVVVALSASEAAAAREVGIASPQQLRVIPNGVVTSLPQAVLPSRAGLGVPEDVPLMGFIGRLCEQKAPLDFVETARRVLAAMPSAHAVLVGSGPMLREVLAAAASLPVGRFHHVVCDSGAEHLLGALDVLVSPSAYEGGPYLPLEAMCAGVPVVASDCAGLRDYVIDGVSGLSVAVGDVDGMSAATMRLLSDPALRDRLVASAREHVATRHHVSDMARSYESLYVELAPDASLPEVPRPAVLTLDVSPGVDVERWRREPAS